MNKPIIYSGRQASDIGRDNIILTHCSKILFDVLKGQLKWRKFFS